jgi:hypothetical protein
MRPDKKFICEERKLKNAHEKILPGISCFSGSSIDRQRSDGAG